MGPSTSRKQTVKRIKVKAPARTVEFKEDSEEEVEEEGAEEGSGEEYDGEDEDEAEAMGELAG